MSLADVLVCTTILEGGPALSKEELIGRLLTLLADLLNAFYQANHAGLLAGQLGAAYFLPTLGVPLLLLTHGLVFRILLQQQPEPAMQASRHLA